MESESLDFGTALAGERVLIRFRLGSDPAVGEPGWEVDNVEAVGILNKPFSAIGDDVTECHPEGLGPKEDGGCAPASGRGALGALLLLGLVIPLGRRRRADDGPLFRLRLPPTSPDATSPRVKTALDWLQIVQIRLTSHTATTRSSLGRHDRGRRRT
jgi:hypothetical protein